MSEWTLWTASVLPPRGISLLRRPYIDSDKDDRAFARVREHVPDAEPAKTDGVIVFDYNEGGDLSARAITADSIEFTDCLESEEWKFQMLDLTNPALIEGLVTSLQAVSQGNELLYELYESDSASRVYVVRRPNPDYIEPEVVPATTSPEDAPGWNVCPRTGQPHVFVAVVPQPVIGKPYMANNFQLCATCNGVFYTLGIPKNPWP